MFLTWLVLHHQERLFVRPCSERFQFFMKEAYTLDLHNQPMGSVNITNEWKSVVLAKYKKQKASAAMLNPY